MIYVIAGILFAIGVLWRNNHVYKFRMALLDKITKASERDLKNGNYHYAWRFEELNKVPYETMMLQFWRSLESFYRGVDFKL